MPIYEYQCQACCHKQEIMHRISEEPSKQCDSCGAYELKKLISAVGFQLKGTGWYETDFKNKGTKKSNESSEESDSSKSQGNKKEAKSDTPKTTNADSKTSTTKSDSGTSNA